MITRYQVKLKFFKILNQPIALLLMVVFSFFIVSFVFAVEKDLCSKITTTPVSKANYYPFITSLSRGPIARDEQSGPLEKGRSFRIIVLDDPVEASLYIEEISSGIDGCCAALIAIRQVDLNQLYDCFNLAGNTAGPDELCWTSDTAFECRINGQWFQITEIENTRINVTRLTRKTLGSCNP